MPGVTGEMVDWWFDWHPRDPLRYRVWHPRRTSRSSSLRAAAAPAAKAHWGTVHHPVEDVGTGPVHARISFCRPTALGFSTDALDDPRVATIACGLVGDDRLHVRHSVMAHVWLREGDGLRPAQPLLARRGAAAGPARRARGGRRTPDQPAVRAPPRTPGRDCRRRSPVTARRSTRTSRTLLPELYAGWGSSP